MVHLENVRAATGFWLIVTAFNIAVVVTQKNTTGLQENNYHRAPCDFENGLCGWTHLNLNATWRISRVCEKNTQQPSWWLRCQKVDYRLQLQMDQLEENGNGTLISPPLFARSDVRCQLSFLYRYDCDNDACQLLVERQTYRGVEQLWIVTGNTGRVETANVNVPCSDTDYKILIVGKKLTNTGVRYLTIDKIQFSLTTVGSTFSSLSRRVSLTSPLTTLDATSPRASESNEFSTDAEVGVPTDRQTEDDEGPDTGNMVAIVVVVVVVVVVIVVLIAIIVVRRRNGAKNKQRSPGSGSGTSSALTNTSFRPEQAAAANPARSSESTEMNLPPVKIRSGLTNQNNADISDDSLTTQPNQYELLSHGTDESRPYEALNNQGNIYETPTNDNGDDKPYDTLFASTRDSDGYELPVSKTNLGKLRKQNGRSHVYNN